jgi:hypothetical protein
LQTDPATAETTYGAYGAYGAHIPPAISRHGGRLELFEATWTELPDIGDTVNLDFVRNVVGKSRVIGGAVVSRTPNSFPFSNGFRAIPVTGLG